MNYELLIRAIHAAKEAQKMGLVNTADTFDELIIEMLSLVDSDIQSNSENIQQQAARKQPRRLSTRTNSFPY